MIKNSKKIYTEKYLNKESSILIAKRWKKISWHQENLRHSLARKGIETGRKSAKRGSPNDQNSTKKNIFAKKWDADIMGESHPYNVLGQFHPKGIEAGKKWQLEGHQRKAEIVMMPPDEFLDIIPKIPESPEEIKKQIKNMKKKAMKGKKFGMAWIEKKYGRITGHEGRHRVLLAKELGIEKIPVVVIEYV